MTEAEHNPSRRTPDDIETAVRDLRQQIEAAASGTLNRVDCSPESIEQGLARLVLSIVELLRQLLERQAVRRLEGGSLSDEQVEQMGLALMRLEAKVAELAHSFGLKPGDLNLDLGPLGRLLE